MTYYTGGCLCKKIEYKISAPPISQGICYCKQCQKISDAPQILTLKVATIDNLDSFKPEYLVWTEAAGPSCIFPPEVLQFKGNAPLSLLLKID